MVKKVAKQSAQQHRICLAGSWRQKSWGVAQIIGGSKSERGINENG